MSSDSFDIPSLEELPLKAKNRAKEQSKYLQKLKKKPKQLVDAHFHALHEAVFDCVDCLQCANCCKTVGPRFERRDIERIAKVLRLKPAEFEAQYLRIDEDGDHVLQSTPCPFLGADNHCSIYEDRPKACREYPHTDRVNMPQILGLTQKNAGACPAVYAIVERLQQILPL